MDSGERERMRRLLIEIQRPGINKPKRKRTFMEVAGVQRREVTTSKILAFLLETEAEHGMGDLWLRSLLQAASEVTASFEPDGKQLSPASCSTEVITRNVEQNLRIDVVAETPDLVLGIENKIDASLYNDLSAYAGQVSDMADGRDALLLTLTLHDEAEPTAAWTRKCAAESVALCNVTYAALFGKVRENMGEFITAADAEWVLFARDFMRTIENLGGHDMQFDAELFAFMGDNISDVMLLKGKMEEITRATKEQGNRLQEMMLADEELASAGIGKPRVWSPDKYFMWCATFYDVALEERKGRLHPEVFNSVSAMEVRTWVSNATAKAAAKKAILDAGLPIAEEREEHIVVAEYPIDAPEDELIGQLKLLVRALLPIIKK